jgi:hypothetical protein
MIILRRKREVMSQFRTGKVDITLSGSNGERFGVRGRKSMLANQRMAAALKGKRYPYRYVFAGAAGHTDRRVTRQTLLGALEWLWLGCAAKCLCSCGLESSARCNL